MLIDLAKAKRRWTAKKKMPIFGVGKVYRIWTPRWSSPVQHVDVCVILPAFCGFMFSSDFLKQLGAFRASCRNPKNRIATRSNAWIWRVRFWSRLLLKEKLKTASKWPCPKRKAVARGNPIFGSVEPCDLLETRSSLHYASKPKLGFVQAASFQRNWGGPLLGVQKTNVFTAPKMRLLQ